MNRLIKAELFRLKPRIPFMLLCTAVFASITVLNSLERIDQDLGTQIGGSAVIMMFALMILPCVFAAITGKLYDNGKLGRFEIMAGNRTAAIVFSKIFTDGIIFLIISVIGCCGYYVFVGFYRGTGSFDHALIRLLLIVIVLAHIVCCSILIALCLRRHAMGAVVCYIRFLLIDSAGIPFLMWLVGTVMGYEKLALHIAHTSLMNQMMILISEPVDSMIVLHVLIGFVAEFAIWYFIIDTGIKQRKIA